MKILHEHFSGHQNPCPQWQTVQRDLAKRPRNSQDWCQGSWLFKRVHAVEVLLEQYFSTFFGSRHPLRLKKIWRHPYLDKMTIWGTLSSKRIKKYLAAPLTPLHGTPVGYHCLRKSKCSAFPVRLTRSAILNHRDLETFLPGLEIILYF